MYQFGSYGLISYGQQPPAPAVTSAQQEGMFQRARGMMQGGGKGGGMGGFMPLLAVAAIGGLVWYAFFRKKKK